LKTTILKWTALVLAGLFLSSCSFLNLALSEKLKAPYFAYVRCEVMGVNLTQTNVNIVLSAYNPNKVGLKNVSLSYELFNEGKRFLKGNDIKVELKPQDTSRITVPAEVVYREIIAVVGPEAEKILLGQKAVPVRIDAVLTGNPTLYDDKKEGSLIPFTLKVSRTENIPLPRDQMNKLKDKAIDTIRRKF